VDRQVLTCETFLSVMLLTKASCSQSQLADQSVLGAVFLFPTGHLVVFSCSLNGADTIQC
jgi:hypothetical protein